MSFLFSIFNVSWQQHLKTICDLCHFEQFIRQQMIHLQDFISKRVCHHTLSNMLSNEKLGAHRTQILSCSNLGVGVWFITWPIFPTFRLFSSIFFHFKHTSNCHIFQFQMSFDMGAHIPSTLWVSNFYIAPITTNTLGPMMQLVTPLLPLCEMLTSTRMKTTTCVYFCHFQFFSLMNQHCVHQRWNLHLN
jgi:hypothetical protein